MSRIPSRSAASFRLKTSITAHKKDWQRVSAILLALCLWQLAAAVAGYQFLIPTPLSVLRRLCVIWLEPGFWNTVFFTFRRIVSGFLLAFTVGTLLGAMAGRFPLFEILFRPYALMIKSVPVASFIVICLIWLSSSRLSVFISFLMVLPIVYSNVLHGIKSADRNLLEAAAIFRLPFRRRLLYLWLPQLKPFLFSACSIGLGLSWKAGIAAEIIGIPDGSIGRMFYDAKVYFNTVDLFVWTVIVVLISILFEKLFLSLLKTCYRRLEHL